MAYAVKRSTISPAAANSIRTMLCLQPDTPNSKYNRGNVPDPILFYNIDGDIVRLPYLFSASLFQTTPNIDIPYPITQLEFTGTLRDNQIAVEAESWDQLERYGTSTLGLYPGFGKTILGAKLASRAKLMTVILVHREILTIQWKKTFEDFTNAHVWIVGEKNPPYASRGEARLQAPICDVIICMDTRWHLVPPQMRDSVGFLIIDEAHAFCTPTHVSCLLSFNPKYILAESATLERDDGMHSMIYAIVGNHGVFRETDKPFSVMKIMTNTKPVRKQNRMGGVDWNALVQATLFDQRRNQIILNLVTANPQNTILILTSLVDHARLLYDSLVTMCISCDYMCGNRKNYNDCRVLVGTTSKIGTGFDQATACPNYSGRRFDLLILACSIKKYAMLVQNVGRVFRSDYPTIMFLVDNDDIYKSHWYRARKWFLARGGTITEHNIPNLEQPVPTTSNMTASQQSWSQTKANQLALKYQDPTRVQAQAQMQTQCLTLNITKADPLTTIQANLHTVQPIGQTSTQLMNLIPTVELNTYPKLTMTIVPQIPLQPLEGQSPLIFGRKSLTHPTEMLNDLNTTESPILSVKTDTPIKLEILPRGASLAQPLPVEQAALVLPTLPVKTETPIKLEILPRGASLAQPLPVEQAQLVLPTLPVKTEAPIQCDILPTLTVKTEQLKQIEITPTLTVKTELPKHVEILPTLTVKTELPKQVAILPTLTVKTELPKQVAILPTLTVKTEPPTKWNILPTESVKLERQPVVAITGEQPLIFARRTCL